MKLNLGDKMKKIVFKQVYMCTTCCRKIVGFTNKCPVCKNGGNIVKTDEDRIITFTKNNK